MCLCGLRGGGVRNNWNYFQVIMSCIFLAKGGM